MSDLSDKRLELERLGYVRVNAWQASAVEPEIYAAPPKVDDEGRARASKIARVGACFKSPSSDKGRPLRGAPFV